MDYKKSSYNYNAFGLNIASQIAITALEEADFDKPDIHIYEGRVKENLHPIINEGPVFQSNNNEFLLRLEKVASFYVKNGDEIIIQKDNDIDDRELSTFINGACFGSLLHQRGMHPLHASTVVFNKTGIILAGISGAGKSTLAAAMIQAGAMLVADDISCIEFVENMPFVRPSLPAIKMWQDSLTHLGLFSENLWQVRNSLRKYYLPVENYSRKPAEIHSIFVLNFHNSEKIEIQEIHGVEKFRLLKKNTYFFKGISGTALMESHFNTTNRLIAGIPVYVIRRPGGNIETQELISAIAKKLNI